MAIELGTFSDGLGVIGLQLNVPVTSKTMKAYWAALCDETEPEEWAEFCRTAAKRKGWTFLPSVPQLLDGLREFRGNPPLLFEAVAAYERVLEAGEYTAEAGRVWSFRSVKESCGMAAAEAFLAAGGHSAFASTYRESDRRERFIACYVEAVREDSSAGLLMAPKDGEPKQIAAGPVDLPREEARKIVQRLHDLAAVPVEAPKPAEVRLSEDRRRLLENQARLIQEPEPEVVP